MTSKMPNPHYSPEVQVKISLVNFTVTQSGLEEQLLGATVCISVRQLIFTWMGAVDAFPTSRRVRAVASRYLGTAAL